MPKSRRQDCLDGLSIEKFLNSYKKCASKKVCVFPNSSKNSLLAWDYKKQNSNLSDKHQELVNFS